MEQLDWVILGLIFILAVGVTFSLAQWFVEWRRKRDERLVDLDDEDKGLVLGELTPILASQSPVLAGKRKVLQQELREAGYYRPTALMEYSAVRAVLILIPLGVTLTLAAMADPDRLPVVLAIGLAFSVLGYSVPRVIVNYQAKMRSREIERGLPVAVDLLSLGLTGGQNIFTSLKRVYRELRVSFPVLAHELQIVHDQAELASLDLALQHFANRTNIQEVRTLALVLAQSERLGTDISQALLEFSTNFRTNMRQRAETYANRASFWMLFPTVLCLWIPSIVILLAPLIKELSDRVETSKKLQQEGFIKSNKIIDEAKKNLKK
jgi:tight adherence protein C